MFVFQNFSINRHTEKQNENKKLIEGEFHWTEKYLKVKEYINIYNKTLFARSYLIFFIFKMHRSTLKVYQQNESVSCEVFPSKHSWSTVSLVDLDKPQCH